MLVLPASRAESVSTLCKPRHTYMVCFSQATGFAVSFGGVVLDFVSRCAGKDKVHCTVSTDNIASQMELIVHGEFQNVEETSFQIGNVQI
jgi:hypothetical protein